MATGEIERTERDEGRITDEGIADLGSRIGKPLRHLSRDVVVTQEWIDRFALGIGDLNPIWTDPLYARRTRYGGTLAPPTMVFCLSGWDIGTGLPGVHGMYTGCDIEWFDVIRPGDELASHGHLCEISEKHGSFAGRSVLQGTETVFENSAGAVVARARNYNLRTERRAARERGSQQQVQHATYSPEELAELELIALRHTVRADLPRPGAEVEVGEALSPVVKGPLTATDVIAFMRAGFGGILEGLFMYAHDTAVIWRRRHPRAVIRTPWGYDDSPEAVHWDDYLAQQAGVPAAYDLGPQRISWMAQCATSWMGDDGFLKRLAVRVRRFVIMGDAVTCTGEVSAKRDAGDETEVEIALLATNQRGEPVADGTATVVLPR
ncbi:MAG TPA: MaoC family dehydratase N-terminal domain-containing protein [Gaiellaceae bacterium]|nr:MaoC family dehydratase N-terminal domain-containing protein [Gaiellaceae bacterium]